MGLSPELMAESSYVGSAHVTAALASGASRVGAAVSNSTQAVANSRAVRSSMQAYEAYGDGAHAVNQIRRIWQHGATVSQEVEQLFWTERPPVQHLPATPATTVAGRVAIVVSKALPIVNVIFAAISIYTSYSELSQASESETGYERWRHRFAAIGAAGSIGLNTSHAIKGFYAVKWAGEKALKVVPGLSVVSAIFSSFSIVSRMVHLRDLGKQRNELELAGLENTLESRKISHEITQERIKCAIDALSLIASLFMLVTPVGPVAIAIVIIAASSLQLVAIGHNRWCAPKKPEEDKEKRASSTTGPPRPYSAPDPSRLFSYAT